VDASTFPSLIRTDIEALRDGVREEDVNWIRSWV
jgi:hypothetical protein